MKTLGLDQFVYDGDKVPSDLVRAWWLDGTAPPDHLAHPLPASPLPAQNTPHTRLSHPRPHPRPHPTLPHLTPHSPTCPPHPSARLTPPRISRAQPGMKIPGHARHGAGEIRYQSGSEYTG